MNKKYFNDAFIGNKNITVSFTKYGELLRLYYPLPDYRQYSEFFHVGLKVNDSNMIYLHNDANNKYKQYYTENTNILNTEIDNSYFKLHVLQTDAVMIDKDVILKKYLFRNDNSIDLKINFLVHSKTMSSFNNQAGSYITDEALVQYSHNFTCAIFSNTKTLSHQLNNTERNIESGVIYDKGYISQASDAAISYDLRVLKPGEEKEFTIVMFMDYEHIEINSIGDKIEELRKIKVDRELRKIEKYWKRFLIEHNTLEIKSDGSKMMDKAMKIYNRTILYMPLLLNNETGGISASLEVDEERDKSGRYSFCWPRDNVMVYLALDFLGFDNYGDKFYQKFLKETQDKNGMWEQRFYTDGRLAPCWGYQIDETAEVVWGALKHYQIAKNYFHVDKEDLLFDILPMLEKACEFLEKYINYVCEQSKNSTTGAAMRGLVNRNNANNSNNVEVVNNSGAANGGIATTSKENEKEDELPKILPQGLANQEDERDNANSKNNSEQMAEYMQDEIYKRPSFDIWEMTEGIHLFSMSAIYAAFNSMIQIYEILAHRIDENRKVEIVDLKLKYGKLQSDVKQFIIENMYDQQKKVLKRNTSDNLTDISVLGAIIPFNVFEATDEMMVNTIDQINLTLRTYNSGYLRFQNDTYIGGRNPWIIATAMMGMYYVEAGNMPEAQKCMEFILDNATPLDLLPEQSNKDLNQTWVIGLGWSHAKFINFLLEYLKITKITKM